jgi:2-amino-4-hydroxy-6-hydroxymethyldihydropteridine diphosphokinase
MSTNRAVVGLGSNIHPRRHIAAAIEALAREHRIVVQSRPIETAPIGDPVQPNYLNAAALLETDLDCDELKSSLDRPRPPCLERRGRPP